jgi:hypothetical protein
MPPAFQQLIPYRGVDEHIPTGGAGIIVPLGGSNTVILATGLFPSSSHLTIRLRESAA